MKYRHEYHAGNFADVHKHVTLVALIEAMQRKDKGFLFLDTHAGRGAYGLRDSQSRATHEAQAGIGRLGGAPFQSPEVLRYLECVTAFRAHTQSPDAYPGSPVIAAGLLRPQDRAIFVEQVAAEGRALERALHSHFASGAAVSSGATDRPSEARSARWRVEVGDGFALLRAHLPPTERRGLVLLDPPYEDAQDFERVSVALFEALRRFETAVIAVWYPIKDARDTAMWHDSLARRLSRETLLTELWVYPCDSRVALNGSGVLILNPPYLIADRMRQWLPELRTRLDSAGTGGERVRTLVAGP